MQKTTFTALLVAALWAPACCFLIEHRLIKDSKTWDEAQRDCRQRNANLSSVSNQVEMQQILDIMKKENTNEAWIGLHREASPTKWLWSDGSNVTYLNWGSFQPNEKTLSRACIRLKNSQFNDKDCGHRTHYFCSQKKQEMVVMQMNMTQQEEALIYTTQEMVVMQMNVTQQGEALVNEMVVMQETMTWEDALVYCRSHYKDLVSFVSEEKLAGALQTIGMAQGIRWWTGLRYLGNSWIWVNGDPVNWNLTQVPPCPEDPYRCGVLNSEEQQEEVRSCEEQLGFMCLLK